MPGLLAHIEQNKKDGITWYIDSLIKDAGSDIYQQAEMVRDVLSLLSLIKDDIVKNAYVKMYSSKLNLTKKQLADKVNETAEHGTQNLYTGDDGIEDPFSNMPKWMDKESIMTDGFCAVNNEKVTGYYSWGGSGSAVEVTNFIIHPIFHVYEKEESTHVLEVQNNRKRVIMEVPSKALVSPDIFQNYLVGEGNFIIFGSKAQILRISRKLLEEFNVCLKIKQLGWHRSGLYIWSDKVYKPNHGFIDISKWGTIEANDNKYLIPSASSVYDSHKEGDNDPFENERQLTYKGNEQVNFSRWAEQIYKVYGDAGCVMITYLVMSVFYDIVFEIDNNCPHLYFFGERSSGKSKAAKSVRAPFMPKRSPWQLNSGTDAAFFGYVSTFRNVPNELNEFDINVIRPGWFDAIKGFYDGEGRGRKAMDARNSRRQETLKADGTIILLGQFLVTADDNSVITRSLIQKFAEREFDEEQKQQFNLLQSWEDEGLSYIITQILDLRPIFKEQYREIFNGILSEWRQRNQTIFNQRIFQNWCHTATVWKMVSRHFTLPLPYEIYDHQAFTNASEWSMFVRETDVLSEFWKMVEHLLEQNEIIPGWDFRIETVKTIKLRNSDGNEIEKDFKGATKKLLFIRLTNVHKKYMEYAKRTGLNNPISSENLKHYYTSRAYYIGQVKQKAFKRLEYVTSEKPNSVPNGSPLLTQERKTQVQNSSALVFDYDMLGCNLEFSSDSSEEENNNSVFPEIF